MTTPPAQQPLQPLSVFNPEKILKQFDQSHSRAIAVIEVMEQFIEKGHQPIVEARRALKNGYPEQAAHLFHSLKVSVGNLGGMRVFELAENLENSLKYTKSSINLTNAQLEAIEKEYSLFLDEANIWLKKQKTTTSIQKDVKLESNMEKKRQLEVFLAENNLRATDLAEELAGFLTEALTPESYKSLKSSIEQLDFAQAILCLKKI